MRPSNHVHSQNSPIPLPWEYSACQKSTPTPEPNSPPSHLWKPKLSLTKLSSKNWTGSRNRQLCRSHRKHCPPMPISAAMNTTNKDTHYDFTNFVRQTVGTAPDRFSGRTARTILQS